MLNTLTRQLLPLAALAFAFVLARPQPRRRAGRRKRGAGGLRRAEVQRSAMPSPARASKRTRSTASARSCRPTTSSSGSSHPTEMTAKTKSTKKPPMPAKYGNLPAADLDALVAYMQSLK